MKHVTRVVWAGGRDSCGAAEVDMDTRMGFMQRCERVGGWQLRLVWKLLSGVAIALVAVTVPVLPAAAQDLLWLRQFGTPRNDVVNGVAVDGASNVYIAGRTSGDLGLANPWGFNNRFLAKYDTFGGLLWMRQVSTAVDAAAWGVAVDWVGNAYVTGESQGYIFLAKYDGFGNSLWTRQTGLSGFALASGVAVDREGNAYITGYTDGDLGGPNVDPTHNTMDFFLAKYDASGSRLWMRQAGSMATDKAYGVAVDAAGNAYLAGGTNGNLGGPNSGVGDSFAAKYDGSGSQLWLRHIGSARDDRASSLAVDGAGNMYIVGDTAGDLGGPNAGPENTYDIFVAKYDPSGNQLWLRQIGSAVDDRALAAAVDGEGSVFVAGASNGNLVGFNAGGLDIFLIKYDSSGTLLWMQQAGSAANDVARGVAVDGADHVYLAGFTLGDFGGLSAGGDDIFVAKYGPPSCASIADVAGGLGGPDGVVDGSDFVAFINSFGIGDWATDALADVNGDGTIDGSDFIAFINAFAAGC